MNALQLLDSRSFRNKLDAFVAIAAKKRAKDEDLAEYLQPVLDAALGAMPAVKERPGPAQAPVIDRKAPAFDMGQLGDTHDLPFDPFEHQSTEPNPASVMIEQGAMLMDALKGLPDKGMGEKVKFNMSMDWNASQAPIFFEAAVKDGAKWALAPDGEGVRLGADKNSWEVTAIRVR